MPKKLYDRDQILESCMEVFAKYGYENSSVVKLAKESGISRTLIFHHFNNKKDLYLEIVDRIAKEVGEDIEYGFMIHNSDYFKAREEISRFKFNFCKNNPLYYRIMKEVLYDTPKEIQNELRMRFGHKVQEYNKKWEELFSQVPLKKGVDRKQAYELIQIILEYFDNKYFSETAMDMELNEAYFHRFLTDRNRFLTMVRFGIQDQQEG